MDNTELEAICNQYHIEWCSYYGEPGYPQPVKGILFANWNNVPDGIGTMLETAGFELEWEDEWTICYETDKAYRTSPDCYSWTPYYVLTDDGELIGGDEIESGDQADWYINQYLLNNPTRCNVFKRLDLSQHGFQQAYPNKHDSETGLHTHMTDDPKTTFKRTQKTFPNHDIIFDLTTKSQFFCTWRTWVRPKKEAPQEAHQYE